MHLNSLAWELISPNLRIGATITERMQLRPLAELVQKLARIDRESLDLTALRDEIQQVTKGVLAFAPRRDSIVHAEWSHGGVRDGVNHIYGITIREMSRGVRSGFETMPSPVTHDEIVRATEQAAVLRSQIAGIIERIWRARVETGA